MYVKPRLPAGSHEEKNTLSIVISQSWVAIFSYPNHNCFDGRIELLLCKTQGGWILLIFFLPVWREREGGGGTWYLLSVSFNWSPIFGSGVSSISHLIRPISVCHKYWSLWLVVGVNEGYIVRLLLVRYKHLLRPGWHRVLQYKCSVPVCPSYFVSQKLLSD